MAVMHPVGLLLQAEYLLQERGRLGHVRQSNRNRAISTAYYAVFHFALKAMANELIGRSRSDRNSDLYALAYRSIDHRRLEELCKEVRKPNPSEKFKRYMPVDGFCSGIKEFAALVVDLKEQRNLADYDPQHRVSIATAKAAIAAARSAVAQFQNASPIEQKTFLTLLAFSPR